MSDRFGPIRKIFIRISRHFKALRCLSFAGFEFAKIEACDRNGRLRLPNDALAARFSFLADLFSSRNDLQIFRYVERHVKRDEITIKSSRGIP